MKVLFSTNYPSPYRVNFFNELGKKCDLTVIFEESPKEQIHRSKYWFIADYANFKPIFLKSYKLGKAKSDSPHKIIAPSIIKEIKKNFDFRVMLNYNTYSSILAILYMQKKKIPYWIETDGGFEKDSDNALEKLKKRLISGACGYFSPGDFADKYLQHYGAASDLIYRYPFTSLYTKDILKAPINVMSKMTLRNELGMKEKRIILSVGQPIPRKGFDLLLLSMRDMVNEDVGVYIIGGNPTKEYIEMQKSLDLDNKVHFVEFKEKKELAKYYMASDFFVLPTREDVWGLVINEAMAYGLPVITTDRCGAGLTLISSDNGIVVPANKEESLSLALKYLITCGTALLIKLGQNSINKIKPYTFENMAAAHYEIFKGRV